MCDFYPDRVSYYVTKKMCKRVTVSEFDKSFQVNFAYMLDGASNQQRASSRRLGDLSHR